MTRLRIDKDTIKRIFRYSWGWFKHYFGGLYNRADDHHIFLMAGGLSFAVFTCILPMVLIIFAVLGNMLREPAIASEITRFIEKIIPYEQYADHVKEIVFRRVDEFIIYKNLAGIFGAFGLFFAASGLFSSMRTALHTAYKIVSAESVLIGKLRDFVLVIIVIVYFLLSTMILPGLDISQELADQAGLLDKLSLGFLTDFILQGFSILLIFISFFVIYFAIPYPRPPTKAIAVSAIAAAALWVAAQLLFGFYITSVVTLRRVYGAYFFLIVVAFWIYYTSLVFILGAEIGQLYRERAEKRGKNAVARRSP
jgi:membrane protein